MIRKSGSRFSEKIMLKQQSKARLPVSADIARFRCKRATWQEMQARHLARPPAPPGRAIKRFAGLGAGHSANKKPEPSGPGLFLAEPLT
jgi:hypothetical protein